MTDDAYGDVEDLTDVCKRVMKECDGNYSNWNIVENTLLVLQKDGRLSPPKPVFKPRYMMATVAHTKDGRDISRFSADLARVYGEVSEGPLDSYTGMWVASFVGFYDVRFPKSTTRPLFPAEIEKFNGMGVEVNGVPVYTLMMDSDGYMVPDED